MDIEIEDPARSDIVELLTEHLKDMYANSPACSVHALNVDRLRQSDILFWTVREQGQLLGCGALKTLDATHAELKSMRTASSARRRGIGNTLLLHILEQARSKGVHRVSLETGSQAFFEPARQLYLRHGFTLCAPFGDYQPDTHSVFMSLALA